MSVVMQPNEVASFVALSVRVLVFFINRNEGAQRR
jgi:hypothetical protein